MTRTIKVWVRSAVSVTALLLFACQAEAACFLHYMPGSAPTLTVMLHWLCDTESERPASNEGDLAYAIDTGSVAVWHSGAWVPVGGSSGGAPTDALYWVGAPNASLSAEKDLSALTTGLVINTAGTPSAYTGTTCNNQFPRSLSAVGVATCASVSLTGDVAGDLPLSSLAQSGAASKLLGRGSTGAGDFQEITLGTNLSMSGTTLNAAGGGGGGATLLRVTADVPNTTTSFANVTGLTTAVSASTVYYFRCSLAYTTAVSTTAIQVAINGPASPTAMRYEVEVSTTATARHNSVQAAYDTVVNPATGGGATALPVMLSGVLENGLNTGTFAVRFRSEVASSAVTVLRGSWCVVF